MSSRAIWLGPSSPMDTPQWEPTTFKLVWLITPILKLSKPRVRNAAKVEAKATVRSLQATPLMSDGGQSRTGGAMLEGFTAGFFMRDSTCATTSADLSPRALPCQFIRSSMFGKYLPLKVLAMRQVVLSNTDSASANALQSSPMSCPSTTMAWKPKDSSLFL